MFPMAAWELAAPHNQYGSLCWAWCNYDPGGGASLHSHHHLSCSPEWNGNVDHCPRRSTHWSEWSHLWILRIYPRPGDLGRAGPLDCFWSRGSGNLWRDDRGRFSRRGWNFLGGSPRGAGGWALAGEVPRAAAAIGWEKSQGEVQAGRNTDKGKYGLRFFR